jgi:hypothetical protein
MRAACFLLSGLARMAVGLLLLLRRLPIAKSATHGPFSTGLLRRLQSSAAAPAERDAAASAVAEQLAAGIDCGCYYTANLFARGQHYSFRDVAHFSSFAAAIRRSVDTGGARAAYTASHGDEELPQSMASLPAEEKIAILHALEAEISRRRGIVPASRSRKRAIAEGYKRLHPELWELSDDFLHPSFVRLVRGLRDGPAAEKKTRSAEKETTAAGGGAEAAACGGEAAGGREGIETAWGGGADAEGGGENAAGRRAKGAAARGGSAAGGGSGTAAAGGETAALGASNGVLRRIAPGAYVLPVFIPRFCQLMCEELSHFSNSGLPSGQVRQGK